VISTNNIRKHINRKKDTKTNKVGIPITVYAYGSIFPCKNKNAKNDFYYWLHRKINFWSLVEKRSNRFVLDLVICLSVRSIKTQKLFVFLLFAQSSSIYCLVLR
jgi:hypothetical protein